jgi:5-formyltetrahydrofolate cyclo-ligase
MGGDLSAGAIAKASARKAGFAARKAAFEGAGAAQTVARANAHLAQILAQNEGAVLAGYMPMRSEIDPLPAMRGHKGALCVPVIDAPATPLRFAAYCEGDALQMGAFGARIPALLRYLTPRILIVPLLAFDGRGYRLGYGGGFYDRTLQGLRAGGPVLAIGFAFGAQKVAEVPIDAFDQRLDMIITENGVQVF